VLLIDVGVVLALVILLLLIPSPTPPLLLLVDDVVTVCLDLVNECGLPADPTEV
jgi:hypothetical protein